MAAIELTKAAFEAVEREARDELESAIQERFLPTGDSGHRQEQTDKLLVCADILGAMHWTRLGWDEEHGESDDAMRAIEFTPQALAFLEKQRVDTARHIQEQDTLGEVDYAVIAGDVFLLHVLDQILGERGEAVAA